MIEAAASMTAAPPDAAKDELAAPTAVGTVTAKRSKRKRRDAPAKARKVPAIKPRKEKASEAATSEIWRALNWNTHGGAQARHYPFVVARDGAPSEGDDEHAAAELVCLSGPSGRLLRFATEQAARIRAGEQNQTSLDLFS